MPSAKQIARPGTFNRYVFGVLLVGLISLGGCQRWGNPMNHARPVEEFNMEKAPGARMDVITHPRMIRESFAYPSNRTLQAFYWQEDKAEWRIKFPASGYAYAGFHLLKPIPFRGQYRNYSLQLEINQSGKLPDLWIGIRSGFSTIEKNYMEAPATPYLVKNPMTGNSTITIPLRHFQEATPPTDNHPLQSGNQFDWNDLCEFRIISPAESRRPAREILVTKIRFVR